MHWNPHGENSRSSKEEPWSKLEQTPQPSFPSWCLHCRCLRGIACVSCHIVLEIHSASQKSVPTKKKRHDYVIQIERYWKVVNSGLNHTVLNRDIPSNYRYTEDKWKVNKCLCYSALARNKKYKKNGDALKAVLNYVLEEREMVTRIYIYIYSNDV